MGSLSIYALKHAFALVLELEILRIPVEEARLVLVPDTDNYHIAFRRYTEFTVLFGDPYVPQHLGYTGLHIAAAVLVINIGVLLTYAPYSEYTAIIDRHHFEPDIENQGQQQNPENGRNALHLALPPSTPS
jgi:hypothetical protein